MNLETVEPTITVEGHLVDNSDGLAVYCGSCKKERGIEKLSDIVIKPLGSGRVVPLDFVGWIGSGEYIILCPSCGESQSEQ